MPSCGLPPTICGSAAADTVNSDGAINKLSSIGRFKLGNITGAWEIVLLSWSKYFEFKLAYSVKVGAF